MESLAGMRYHDYEEPTQLARRVAAAGGERRTTREQIAEEYGRVRSDPTMQTLDRMNVLGRDRGHAEFGQVGSGALETSLRTALAEAIDPVSVAMAERNKQKDAEINALYRQMEEEGAWSRMHKALSGQVTARRTYNEAVESRDPEPRRRRMAPGGLVRDPNDYPLAQAIQQKISLVLDAISRKMDGGEFFGNTLNRTNDARDAAPGSLQ